MDESFGKKFAGKYIFESISWGRSNRITGECTKVHPVTRVSSIDMKKLQAMMLDATMIKRPKAVTYEVLVSENTDQGLPPSLGEILMAMADKVNGYGKESRDKLKKLKRRCGLE